MWADVVIRGIGGTRHAAAATRVGGGAISVGGREKHGPILTEARPYGKRRFQMKRTRFRGRPGREFG
jgi:hypothetical protein